MKLPSLPEGEITAIEVHRANPYVELGISVVGGNETPLINIVIQEVYRDGVIARDGRLLAGDQILQVRAVVIFGFMLTHFHPRKELQKPSLRIRIHINCVCYDISISTQQRWDQVTVKLFWFPILDLLLLLLFFKVVDST